MKKEACLKNPMIMDSVEGIKGGKSQGIKIGQSKGIDMDKNYSVPISMDI